MRLIIIIIALFTGLVLMSKIQAQVPGFMGKKLIVNAKYAGMWNTFPAYNNQIENGHWLSRLSLEAEYVVSRNSSIGLLYGFTRNGINMSFPIDRWNQISGQAGVNHHDFLFNHRVYFPKSKVAAPLGTWLQFNAGIAYFKIVPNNIDIEFDDFEFDDDFVTFTANVGLGRNVILGDWLIINGGMQMGFVSPKITYSHFYHETIINRANSYAIFTVFVGAGVLIF